MKFVIHDPNNADQRLTCQLAGAAMAPYSPHDDPQVVVIYNGQNAYVHADYEAEYAPRPLTQADVDRAYYKLRIANLEAWKEEAMQVMAQLDLQKVGKLMGLTCGDKILENIIPYIEHLHLLRDTQWKVIQKYGKQIDAMYEVIDAVADFFLDPINRIKDLRKALNKWQKSIDPSLPKS